jgi:hypothetical protein
MDEARESSPTSDQYSPPSLSKLGRRSTVKTDQARAETTDRSVASLSDRPGVKYLTVTIDADSAHVVRVDGLDITGVPRELSADERAALVKDLGDAKLQDVIEQAFEAGIACVLGGDDADTPAESAEDVELRRRLLAPLIERSAVGRLMERGALNRVVLSTLIHRDTT